MLLLTVDCVRVLTQFRLCDALLGYMKIIFLTVVHRSFIFTTAKHFVRHCPVCPAFSVNPN